MNLPTGADSTIVTLRAIQTRSVPPNSSLRRVKSRTALSCQACDGAKARVKAFKVTKARPKSPPIRLAGLRAGSMDSRYHRPHSPGSRRLAIPARSSTGTFDNYDNIGSRSPRDSYASPRASGVIPISTETYQSSITDGYSNRPRRLTVTTDRQRPSISYGGAGLSPSSPGARYDNTRDGYAYPATSSRREHKKVYSIENGHSRLVGKRDVDLREYGDSERPRERRGGYHLSGPSIRSREVDDAGYSYTDAAGMYRDTEPPWRPRRGSIDRAPGSRPTSMVDQYGPPARASTRDFGPPPARGLEKLNETLSRTGSLRDPRTSSRERTGTYDSYLAPVADPFERPNSARPSGPGALHDVEKYGLDRAPYDDEREPRAGGSFKDDHVETRGFGIRSGSVGQRGSSADSLDMRSALAPRPRPIPAIYADDPTLPLLFPHDYIPQIQVDDGRREVERREAERRERDRLAEREVERRNPELRERDRPKDRDYERLRGRERETERDRGYGGEYDRDKPQYDSRNHEDPDRHRHSSIVAPAAAAATAAAVYGVATAGSDKRDRDDNHRDERQDWDRRHERDEEEPRTRAPLRKETMDREPPPRSTDYDRERSRRDPREHDDPDRHRHSSIAVPAAATAATAAVPSSDGYDREKFRRVKEHDDIERHRHLSVAAPSLAPPAPAAVEAPPASEKRDRTRGLDREEEEARIRRPSRQDPNNREDARAIDYDREKSRRTKEHDDSDRHRHSSIAVPAAAAATAAVYGATSGTEKRDRDRGLEIDVEEDRMRRPSRQEAPPTSPQEKRDWDRELVRAEEEPRARRTAKQDPHDREDIIEHEFAERDRQERRKSRRDSPEEDPDEDYRRRVQQQQMELARQEAIHEDRPEEFDRDRERHHREQQDEQALALTTTRHNSVFDDGLTHESDLLDKDDLRESRERENRLHIVEPPKSESPPPPVKSILKQPTQKFPEHPNPVREGVAPLKDPTKKGIPPSARWTKIDRRLVNPQALEELQERFEERLDCVIVLRVLTKEEIQKFADRTAKIRAARDEGATKKHGRKKDDDRESRRKDHDNDDDDDDNDDDSERESRKRRDRDRDRDREPRDKDRDRDRDRDRDGHRGKDREREDYHEAR